MIEVRLLRSKGGQLGVSGPQGVGSRECQEVLAEAIGLLQKSSQLEPGRPDTWYFLGVALVRQGQPSEDAAALQRSAQIAPMIPDPDPQAP